MVWFRRYLPLLGRVLLSAIFLLSGFGKIVDWSGSTAYMASKGMPYIPLFLAGAIALELVGGLSVLLAWKPKWGAWLLFLYLIPTSLIFHNFWALVGPERLNQMAHFLKNLTIMGGLVVVASVPEKEVKVGAGETLRELQERRRVA